MTDSPNSSKIIYTHTDEAPALATYSLLPIVEAYAAAAGVSVETRDISLSGRILAQFADRLPEDQRIDDALAELGELATKPEANIIKLPNISASIPQLKAAIAELQEHGYDLPAYPDEPKTDEEKDVRARYDKVKGSAVNPVLREGNSDRRAPASVKQYARKHPHSMGAWSADSRTNVAHMTADDFRSNEKSAVIAKEGSLRIELAGDDGSTTVLRESVPVLAGEIVDGTVMRVAALREFLTEQIARAKADDVLFSVHLKATMMKVSDPIIFGHVVRVFFPDLFAKYGDTLAAAGVSPNDGLGAILKGVESLPEADEIKAAVQAGLDAGPALAMVDSDKGITNLHVPSDVIVDASMPAMIRTSGHMWGPDGNEADTLAVIPDSSYAGIYQVVIDDCRKHGAYDPATMGSVSNVGLMAQAAEEYGSHDKTFEIPATGTVRVVDQDGNVVLEHAVSAGDIWRMCQTKDVPVQDWVKLAVTRARATGVPAVFWLDEGRAHDANLIAKVNDYLPQSDTRGHRRPRHPDHGAGRRDRVLPRADPQGPGHHLRHRQRAARLPHRPVPDPRTRHQRQDALHRSADERRRPVRDRRRRLRPEARAAAPRGELPALGQPRRVPRARRELRAPRADTGNAKAQVLADTLDPATGNFPRREQVPGPQTGHHRQPRQPLLPRALLGSGAGRADRRRRAGGAFAPVAKALAENESTIVAELLAVQGTPVDIGGYYRPDEKAAAVMRPSKTLNETLATLA